MNWVGKFFIVAVTVLSILFGFTAIMVYSTHKNWRDMVMRPRNEATGPDKPIGLKYQLEDEQQKRQQLTEKYDKLQQELQAEKAARADQIGKLETERTALLTRVKEQENVNAVLVQKSRQADEAMLATHKTLENMRETVDKLRTEIRAAQQDRDGQFQEVVKLTDDLNQAKTQLDNAKAQNMELGEQVARMTKVLDRHDISPNASVDALPPQVDGVVLASSRDGLVEISLGSDDGIEKGHKLEVYRGAKYLGRIEVYQTTPDKSVARILPEFRKGPIAKEDRVATRLN